jgi:hypothetical protein
LINWKGKRKESSEEEDEAGICFVDKTNVLTALRGLNWQIAFSLWNRFFQENCVSYHHKIHISEEDSFGCHMSSQYTGSSCTMAVVDSRSIPNYVVLVDANNSTCKCKRLCFSLSY